jgi:hypothetical protein
MIRGNYFERHPDATDLVTEMWKRGHSGGEIVAACTDAFGEAPTRNMIMGKVSRMAKSGKVEFKTKNRPGPRANKRIGQDIVDGMRRVLMDKKRQDNTPRALPVTAALPPLPSPRPIPPTRLPVGNNNGKVVFLNARGFQCKWFNDGEHGVLGHVCGKRTVPGKAWCEEHMKRAYVPNQPPRLKLPPLRFL